MPNSLRAIGFPEVVDEASLQATLAELAGRARKAPDGSLVARPVEGCQVRMHLDHHGQIDRVAVEFEGPEQTLAIYRVDEASDHGWLARSFTCVDCQPVAPVTVLADSLPLEFELRQRYFCRLSGFLDEIEPSNAQPGDMAFGQPGRDGALPMVGMLLSVEERKNHITDSVVSLGTVALPALILTATIPNTGLRPGQMVQGSGQILAVFGDRVP